MLTKSKAKLNSVYGLMLPENFYSRVLAWSIKKLVNRQKTYQGRCEKLNNIINSLVDIYCDYTKGGNVND